MWVIKAIERKGLYYDHEQVKITDSNNNIGRLFSSFLFIQNFVFSTHTKIKNCLDLFTFDATITIKKISDIFWPNRCNSFVPHTNRKFSRHIDNTKQFAYTIHPTCDKRLSLSLYFHLRCCSSHSVCHWRHNWFTASSRKHQSLNHSLSLERNSHVQCFFLHLCNASLSSAPVCRSLIATYCQWQQCPPFND